jgi:hypothetical protein
MMSPAIHNRQRGAFVAAMKRDGWLLIGAYWSHKNDSLWLVPDADAFRHYVVTWQTPMCVRDELE